MKASRRHELKENDLAHALSVVRDYMSDHGTKCGIIIVVVVAVAAAASIAVRSRADDIEHAWSEKNNLVFDGPEQGRKSLEKLGALTAKATDDNFVLVALVEQGMHALRLAQEVDAPPDPDLNKRAREAFEAILARFGDNPLAFGAAHCGLATVEENEYALDSDQSHKKRAEAHLRKVIENPALSGLPFQQMASDRLDRLDSIFTIVRFASPPEPAEPEPAAKVDEPAKSGKFIEVTPTVVPSDAAENPQTPPDQGEESDNTP